MWRSSSEQDQRRPRAPPTRRARPPPRTGARAPGRAPRRGRVGAARGRSGAASSGARRRGPPGQAASGGGGGELAATSSRISSAHRPSGAAPPRSSAAHDGDAGARRRGRAPSSSVGQPRLADPGLAARASRRAPAPVARRGPALAGASSSSRSRPDQRQGARAGRDRARPSARRRRARAPRGAAARRARAWPARAPRPARARSRSRSRPYTASAARGRRPRPAAHEVAVRLLVERVERDLRRRVQRDRRLGVARPRRPRRPAARARRTSRSRCSSRACSAHSSSNPASSSPRAELGRLREPARGDELVERADVDPQSAPASSPTRSRVATTMRRRPGRARGAAPTPRCAGSPARWSRARRARTARPPRRARARPGCSASHASSAHARRLAGAGSVSPSRSTSIGPSRRTRSMEAAYCGFAGVTRPPARLTLALTVAPDRPSRLLAFAVPVQPAVTCSEHSSSPTSPSRYLAKYTSTSSNCACYRLAPADHSLFEGTELFFPSGYIANLVYAWLPALESVDAPSCPGGATVADVGLRSRCLHYLDGRGLPASTFVGFDYHEASVPRARNAPGRRRRRPLRVFEVAPAVRFPR